jgi:hypothetical protein
MIYRSEHKTNYTVISNECIRDKRLSLKARGLLILMLSQRNDYNFSLASLRAMCQESVCAIRGAINELKNAGYLIVRKIHPNDTYEYIYTIRETPIKTDSPSAPCCSIAFSDNTHNQRTANQKTDRQNTEHQGTENRTHINNKYKNNNNINTLNINNKSGGESTSKDEKLKKAFAEYVQMRKDMNRPFTKKSAEMALKGLYEMSSDTEIQIKIIEQSLKNGWLGLYELKECYSKNDDNNNALLEPTSNPDEIEKHFFEIYE